MRKAILSALIMLPFGASLAQAADGWSQADYAAMYEGEPGEPESIKLRITDAAVEIRHANGNNYTGRRC